MTGGSTSGSFTDSVIHKRRQQMKTTVFAAAAAALVLGAGAATAADPIFVGHLVDYTGPTSDVGKPYGQGVADALAWINKNGGIAGQQLKFETVDYSYNAPRAIATYKKWVGTDKAVAIQGWGTADTEALVGFHAADKIPNFSASYSGHLTDPQGKGPKGTKPAPFNFFYGPSYPDGCRALVQWAAGDAKAKNIAQPKFVHLGDNHPYPNAPKEGCAAYATELGFQVMPPIQYSLKPGDFKAQCLSLKDSGAHYAFLANTGGSTISLLKSCETVGVSTQFLGNVWAMDENALKTAGDAADGVMFVVGGADWKSDAPGMKTVREVSKMSDATGNEYRPVHYMRGICSVFYMRDAMAAAAKAGAVDGPGIKAAMEQMKGHVPAELQGVCIPSTWTSEDHRGTTKVFIYRANSKGGQQSISKAGEAEIPRKPEWLGW
jgi:branched-chain amino acid transport system substrate-binding protein